MFSELPLRWKLISLTLFFSVMALWAWAVDKLVYDWLPDATVGYLAVALVAAAAGLLVGDWSARREVALRIGYDPFDDGRPQTERWGSPKRFVFAYVVVGALIAVGFIIFAN